MVGLHCHQNLEGAANESPYVSIETTRTALRRLESSCKAITAVGYVVSWHIGLGEACVYNVSTSTVDVAREN